MHGVCVCVRLCAYLSLVQHTDTQGQSIPADLGGPTSWDDAQ